MRSAKSFHSYFFLHGEWILLVCAMIAMALINPYEHTHTLCLFENLGITFCPGEGFGRSVALMVRGELIESFQMHPLGIPGSVIISHRIYSIFKRNKSI